ASRVRRAGSPAGSEMDMIDSRYPRRKWRRTGRTLPPRPAAASGRRRRDHARGLKPVVEIGQDVIDMLDADGEADIAFGDARSALLLGRELRMSRAGRVDGE